MRIISLLLIIALSSCCYFPSRNSDNLETTRAIQDTVFKVIERPLSKSEHQIFVDTLTGYLGVRETTSNRGPEIDRFMRETCGLIGQAYCGGFLSYGLKVNGHRIPELPCWTPSFFPQDRVTWVRGDEKELKKGEIFGLYFKSKGRVAHVGSIVDDFGDGWVLTIEANTDQAGSREGDGVYKKLRHKSQLYVASDWITH